MSVTNTLLTNDVITNEALRVLRNQFTFVSRCLRTVDDLFGKVGYKNGSTIRVRIPVRYSSGIGSAIVLNNSVESETSITLIQRNIGMAFTSLDLTLSIDLFRERFIEPAMAQLASDVDSDGYALFYKAQSLATPGAYTSGIPAAWTGADVGTLRPYLDAQARLTEQAAPVDNMRYAAISPSANAAIVDSLKSLFQDSTQIADQYKRGLMGLAAGLEWVQSQSIPSFTSGSWSNSGSPIYVAAGSSGSTFVLHNVGNNAVINHGDQFVIANVFAINPLTRKSTGKLQVFTVQAQATASSTGVVTVVATPAVNVTAPDQTVSAAPVDGAAVTFLGTANTTTDANLVWHRDAFMFACCDLTDDLPGAEAYTARDPVSGLVVRLVRQYLSTPDEVQTRVDILYGYQCVRPQLAATVRG
jgi:hypothetical protein